MTSPRIIGEVRSHEGYDGLRAVFLARSVSLGLTGEEIDDLSKLADRYAQKLLSPVEVKSMGRYSLGPLMSALAVKIVIVEDTEMLARIGRKLGRQITKRAVKVKDAGACMLAGAKPKKRRFLPFKGNTDWGRMMRARQILQQPAAQRSLTARTAARARWGKNVKATKQYIGGPNGTGSAKN